MRKLTLILLLFIFSSSYAQWFQLPNLPVSGTVYDINFINANTGFITLSELSTILKTTDGAMSWSVQTGILIGRFWFVDTAIGYATGRSGSNGAIWKTTNGGDNWYTTIVDGNSYGGIYFANKDTGWVVGNNGNFGRIWRTTNGGQSFTVQFATTETFGIDKLFFLKEKLNGEYVGWANTGVSFWRTTNSGVNWGRISNNLNSLGGGINNFYFKDTTNGIISRQTKYINTTTNGGFNWSSIYQSNAGNDLTMGSKNIGWVSLNSDSIIKTTDFFQTYGKQKIPANGFGRIFAVDTSIVYAVRSISSIYKTTNGGGEIVVSIPNNSQTLDNYFLSQNYPNPFNPNTVISYQLSVAGFITLKVYDTKGKEVTTLINQKQNAGNYSINFNGSNLPSGIYFYKLETENFTETKKMVLLK